MPSLRIFLRNIFPRIHLFCNVVIKILAFFARNEFMKCHESSFFIRNDNVPTSALLKTIEGNKCENKTPDFFNKMGKRLMMVGKMEIIVKYFCQLTVILLCNIYQI